jgi:predicted RNase H-like nuclease
MRAVLGIDAAWTAGQPSGVALCVERRGAWRCVALAPSYADLAALASGRAVEWGRPRVQGGAPRPKELLRAAEALAPAATIAAVALDLPLARGAITGRRHADQEVSRRFGARKCGTHSPSPTRPGTISTVVRRGFEACGFRLVTRTPVCAPAVLEVYPHTALLSLLSAPERVPYKVAKSSAYSPGASPRERRQDLLRTWRKILAALREHVSFELDLPRDFTTFSAMKRYEDTLDALVCAWVAIEALAGEAFPLGDDFAAIWTPSLPTGEAMGT